MAIYGKRDTFYIAGSSPAPATHLFLFDLNNPGPVFTRPAFLPLKNYRYAIKRHRLNAIWQIQRKGNGKRAC